MSPLRRFSIMGIRFLRRPVSDGPEKETLGFVDDVHEFGWTDRAVANFKDGKWTKPNGKDLPFVPQYWIVLDPEVYP